jgi:uncharacterized protein (TIGR02118 family)
MIISQEDLKMIRVLVSYPAAPGARFDMDYYLTKHLPLAARLATEMKGWAVDQGLSGGAPGSQPEFLIQAQLLFDSLEAWERTLASVGGEIMADIPKFTDIRPRLQVNQVIGESAARSAGA